LHIVIGLGRKQISRTDVSTAIVGTKNNAESKKLLAFAMSKESLKAEYGAFMDGVYAGGGGLKKYILRADIKEVWVKQDNGIQYTFKGSDVLNGANFLAKGDLLTNDAIYVPKRNIMYVILKNGNKVKPINGYWIKKDAKGDLFKPEKNDEYKVESNVGIFYKVGTKKYWYVVNSKNQTINKNTGKPYKGKEITNYYFLNEDGAKDFAEKLNKGLFVERKFEDGAFMDGVYADGGYFDGTIPKVSNYMTTYVKGGMVVTSIKDIPNFKKNLDEGKITYRGLGMGKVFNDFYDIAGESGTRIKVDGKEYFITDTEFDTFSRGSDGKMRIKFDAPQRKG
jgi:hypothetical protein